MSPLINASLIVVVVLVLFFIGVHIGHWLTKKDEYKRLCIKQDTDILREQYLMFRTGNLAQKKYACDFVYKFVKSKSEDITVDFLRRFLEEVRRVYSKGGDYLSVQFEGSEHKQNLT